MSNEILLFVTIFLSFLGVIFCYRLWGKIGMFGWIAFASVIANIEVIKCVDMFGLSVTLGNVIYGSTFLATDILNETEGGKTSRKAVRLGFFALVMFVMLSQLSLLFIPNESDFASPAMHTLFELSPRICASSLLAYFISNTLDTYLYDWIGRYTTRLWLKNNGGTMISQAIDTILFTFLAFYGVFELSVVWELVITTYAIKFIIAICDTPFLYWARQISRRNEKDIDIDSSL